MCNTNYPSNNNNNDDQFNVTIKNYYQFSITLIAS